MTRLPAIMFVVDPRKEQIAVQEANKLNIPVIAVVDTNCDPDQIDWVIPGNDDAIRAIKLFSSKIADACVEGQARFKEYAAAHREEQVEKPVEAEGRPRKERIPGGPEVEVVRRPSREDRRGRRREAPAAEAQAETAAAAPAEAAAPEGGEAPKADEAPKTDAETAEQQAAANE